MAEEAPKETPAAEPSTKKKPNLQLILLLLNFVVLLAAIGTFVFTKLMFERPAITESDEMQKRKKEAKKPPPSAERVMIPLEEIRINIASSSGKAHFVSFSMTVECANEDMADKFKTRTALVMDKLLSTFNRKQFNELNTIQGRLILKEQLIHEFNILIDDAAVTDIYYTNFVLQ